MIKKITEHVRGMNFCFRYGSDLLLVESYAENNFTAKLARRSLGPAERSNQKYWLGLASLDDLKTNTLESAGGVLLSQYAGKCSCRQNIPKLSTTTIM